MDLHDLKNWTFQITILDLIKNSTYIQKLNVVGTLKIIMENINVFLEMHNHQSVFVSLLIG